MSIYQYLRMLYFLLLHVNTLLTYRPFKVVMGIPCMVPVPESGFNGISVEHQSATTRLRIVLEWNRGHLERKQTRLRIQVSWNRLGIDNTPCNRARPRSPPLSGSVLGSDRRSFSVGCGATPPKSNDFSKSDQSEARVSFCRRSSQARSLGSGFVGY